MGSNTAKTVAVPSSSSGSAISAQASAVQAPVGTVAPVLTLNGPQTVRIDANRQYAPCAGTLTANCELGATATLNIAGDFSARIRACEDQVCAVSNCA